LHGHNNQQRGDLGRDVAMTGPGVIDGSGRHWWEWSECAARNVAKTEPGRIVYRRPHLVVIDRCDRLLVADILRLLEACPDLKTLLPEAVRE